MAMSGASHVRHPWVARGWYVKVDRHHGDLGQRRYWCAQKMYCFVAARRLYVVGSGADDERGTSRHRLSRSRTVARMLGRLMEHGWL